MSAIIFLWQWRLLWSFPLCALCDCTHEVSLCCCCDTRCHFKAIYYKHQNEILEGKQVGEKKELHLFPKRELKKNNCYIFQHIHLSQSIQSLMKLFSKPSWISCLEQDLVPGANLLNSLLMPREQMTIEYRAFSAQWEMSCLHCYFKWEKHASKGTDVRLHVIVHWPARLSWWIRRSIELHKIPLSERNFLYGLLKL